VPSHVIAASCQTQETPDIGRKTFAALLAGVCVVLSSMIMAMGRADAADLARGKYLVGLMGCTDCHTPGHFFGKPDMTRFLGGSDVGFAVPGLGVFVGSNLTSDKETGLGNWTEAQIVTALTTGVTPEGRVLAPPMPWRNFTSLTKSDAQAMAAYLKTLPPVKHQVPGPFGPTQTPTSFVMTVQPGEVYARLAHPAPPPSAPPAAPPAAPAPDTK
jgi:mono/diheme cytochrome c family protein